MDNFTNAARASDRAERTDMDNAKLTRRWRRRLLAAGAVGSAGLLLAATAWACTLRTGTLKACDPGTDDCTSITGNGGQSETITVSATGDSLDVTAKDFLPNVSYTITWAKPGAPGNCHRASTDGQTSTLASNLNGPSFSVTVSTPSSGTGTARMCAQDFNATGDATDNLVVTGNVLTIGVI